MQPVAARQAYLQIPPRELFGADRVVLRAPLDATVLLLSHSSPEITAEIVEQTEVARRMKASLAEERARFMAHYRQFCYAFGDRPNPMVELSRARQRPGCLPGCSAMGSARRSLTPAPATSRPWATSCSGRPPRSLGSRPPLPTR